MPAAKCLELIRDDVAKFDDMLANPAIFSANSPEWDAEDYIGLHESFYLLEPMEERWGKWVSWNLEVHVRELLQQRYLRT